MATQNSDILLSVDNLDVIYDTDDPVHAVQNATFELRRGEMLGLAGESGCGKSTLAYSINQMLKAPGKINSGSVIFHDKSGKDIDIRALSGRSLREYRWEKTSMVFQGAMNSLSPVTKIGKQLADIYKTHRPHMAKSERQDRCAHLLEMVHVDPNRLAAYPFELSGGMRQRVMIAMALALEPQLIIMDEPTTALDVVVQREIIEEISELRRDKGFSVIFITHDLPMLLEITDKIAVMKDGVIVEQGVSEDVYFNPKHPYTQRLLSSFPSLTGDRGSFVRGSTPCVKGIIMSVLKLEHVKKDFTLRNGLKTTTIHAVKDASFELASDKTIALVGESGSGKSTIARMITCLETPTSGKHHVGRQACPYAW